MKSDIMMASYPYVWTYERTVTEGARCTIQHIYMYVSPCMCAYPAMEHKLPHEAAQPHVLHHRRKARGRSVYVCRGLTTAKILPVMVPVAMHMGVRGICVIDSDVAMYRSVRPGPGCVRFGVNPRPVHDVCSYLQLSRLSANLTTLLRLPVLWCGIQLAAIARDHQDM